MKALILIAHGSRAPGAEAVLNQLAQACVSAGFAERAAVVTRPFAEGGEQARLRAAIASQVEQGAREVVIVPLFLALADAWKSALHLTANEAKRTYSIPVRVTPAIGSDVALPYLVELVVQRAAECTTGEMDVTARVVIGHGSSAVMKRDFVSELGKLVPRTADQTVETCFLEAQSPSIGECLQSLFMRGHRQIVCVPAFFLNGAHVRLDIPAHIDVFRGKTGVQVTLAKPFLDHPQLVAAIGSLIQFR